MRFGYTDYENAWEDVTNARAEGALSHTKQGKQ
jgi:hypothetical protein